MAVTITLDDHVAKSVQWALEVTARLGPWDKDMFPGVRVALDVLAPAIVEAEGRAARGEREFSGREVADARRHALFLGPLDDPHAPNALDALDDGWGNDGE